MSGGHGVADGGHLQSEDVGDGSAGVDYARVHGEPASFAFDDESEREIAILEGAALRRADFEWYAHARVGRNAGLTDEELDALLRGTPRVRCCSASTW